MLDVKMLCSVKFHQQKSCGCVLYVDQKVYKRQYDLICIEIGVNDTIQGRGDALSRMEKIGVSAQIIPGSNSNTIEINGLFAQKLNIKEDDTVNLRFFICVPSV